LIERFNDIFQQAGVTFVLNPASSNAARRIHYDILPDGGDDRINATDIGDPEVNVLRSAVNLNHAKLNLLILRGPLRNERAYANATVTSGWTPSRNGDKLDGKQVYITTANKQIAFF
jgi:hypothetical protein